MHESLRERVSIARESVRAAEVRLNEVITAEAGKNRADKIEASHDLRAALSKLRAARAKLEHLEDGVSGESLEVARETVHETMSELDRAIGSLEPSPRSKKVWVSTGVDAALSAARTARERVARLEAALGGPPE